MKFGGKEARLCWCLWLFDRSILAGIVDDHCKRRRFDLIRLSLDSKSNFFLFALLWEGSKRSGKEKDNCFFTGDAFSLKGGSGMDLTLSDLPIMGSKWLMTSFLLVFLKIEGSYFFCFFNSRNNKTKWLTWARQLDWCLRVENIVEILWSHLSCCALSNKP